MIFVRPFLYCVLLIALQLGSCVGIGAAMAQPASGGAQLISTQATSMRVEVNKGRLVRLDQPAASVFVADPAIADIQVKSPTLVYVFAKKAGETTLFAVDQNDQLLANFRISVSHNLSVLEQALRDYIPDAYVKASSLGEAVVLTGVVQSAQQAEDARAFAARLSGGDANVINRIAVKGPNQINLRVRIAEVSRTTLKQIGFNWDALLSVGSFAFGLATGNAVTTTGILGDTTTAVRRTVSGAATESLASRFTSNRVDINGVIDALESEGLLTVLAEPNLTATSGETASFLAGGEFPVPVPQDRDVITIQFKNFGVGLAFTPTLLNDGRINLRVRPEVSQLSSTGEVRLNNFIIPGLSTRRAETTVELGSGQTFAIAGLIQNNVTHDIRRFPGLGDLPILGALFRSDGFRRNETELVIMVTPYVVKPVNDTRLAAAPTDGLVMPNDAERLGRGPLYRQQQPVGQSVPVTQGRRLVGSVGFTLE
jgi:pilus assembly protein CpaC